MPMLTPEGRQARARLAAHKRWNPGDDLDALTAQCMRELETSRDDAKIDALIDAAPRMTPAQVERIRKLANAATDAAHADAVAS